MQTCSLFPTVDPPLRARLTPVAKVQFNGSDYDPELDNQRLVGQMLRVYEVMKDGKWRTLAEIEAITHDPQSSISSQLRHLRKARFGGHLVEKRSRGDRRHGLFEYRLNLQKTPAHN